MPAYRFYQLGDKSLSAPAEGSFYNDGVALVWAFRFAGSDGVEVWQGQRLVGRLHAGASPEEPAAGGTPAENKALVS